MLDQDNLPPKTPQLQKGCCHYVFGGTAFTTDPVGMAEDPISMTIEQHSECLAVTFKAPCPQAVVSRFKVPHTLYCPRRLKRFQGSKKNFPQPLLAQHQRWPPVVTPTAPQQDPKQRGVNGQDHGPTMTPMAVGRSETPEFSRVLR